MGPNGPAAAIGFDAGTKRHSLPFPLKWVGVGSRRGSGKCLRSLRLPLLLTTRPILFLRFPLPDALLGPYRSHSKLAVRTRYVAEVSSGKMGKYRVSLEAQAPARAVAS